MRHECLVCPGVRSAHGVEFGGVRIVIGAERFTSLACVIVFHVMAVGETIVFVFKSAVRRWLGFTTGVGHHIQNGRAVWCLLHVIPRLLLPISAAIVGAVACSGRGGALICRQRCRALLHRRGRRSLLHGQLLLHHVNLRGHHLLKLLLLDRCFLLARHQLVRAILQNVCHVVLVLALVLCCVTSKLVLERSGVGMAEFKVLNSPEIFGVRQRFIDVIAGDPIFVRASVFPSIFDHRQKICNNGVVGDFLAGKSCVCCVRLC